MLFNSSNYIIIKLAIFADMGCTNSIEELPTVVVVKTVDKLENTTVIAPIQALPALPALPAPPATAAIVAPTLKELFEQKQAERKTLETKIINEWLPSQIDNIKKHLRSSLNASYATEIYERLALPHYLQGNDILQNYLINNAMPILNQLLLSDPELKGLKCNCWKPYISYGYYFQFEIAVSHE
jgi:hypothetical protein